MLLCSIRYPVVSAGCYPPDCQITPFEVHVSRIALMVMIRALEPSVWLTIFSKLSFETRKSLNMKVVVNFLLYNFCFRQNFIWKPDQGVNLNFWNQSINVLFKPKFKFFVQTFCINLKNHKHESFSTPQTPQLWF